EQANDPLAARLVISKTEAVKGFEFDTVIIGDLSARIVPSPQGPRRERWREAAVGYAALTPAREEVIITNVDTPSMFLDAVANAVDWIDATDELGLEATLDKLS